MKRPLNQISAATSADTSVASSLLNVGLVCGGKLETMKGNPESQPSYLAAGVPTMSDIDREEQARQAAQVPDSFVIAAMACLGGSFVKRLAELARHADLVNLAKVKAAWPEYWREYENLGRDLWESEGRP